MNPASMTAGIATRRASTRTLLRLYSELSKGIFRLTHARERRHAERLWPHMRIERDGLGRVRRLALFGRTIPVLNGVTAAELALGASGAVAHLIASGPSICDIDYPRLQLGPTLGVNGAIALQCCHSVTFDYYCITDAGFIAQRPALVSRVLANAGVLFLTPLVLWRMAQHFPLRAVHCRIFVIERVGQHFGQPHGPLILPHPPPMHDPPALGFSEDIELGVFPGGTVAFEALQILSWLGFRQICLHGVDLNAVPGKPRFYEREGDVMPTTLDRLLPTVIEPSFRRAAAVLRRRGVSVWNLSPDSALSDRVFPRCHWRSVLPRKATP